jgi:hypothetical protein
MAVLFASICTPKMLDSTAKQSSEFMSSMHGGKLRFLLQKNGQSLPLQKLSPRLQLVQVSNEVYDEVSRYFTPDEIANLLMAIVTINGWNRIAITTQMVPGSYEPQSLQNQKVASETLSI